MNTGAISRSDYKRALPRPVEDSNKRARIEATPFSLPELFWEIVRHLSLYEITPLTLVSKTWYHLIHDCLSARSKLEEVAPSLNAIAPTLSPPQFFEEIKLISNILKDKRKNLIDFQAVIMHPHLVTFRKCGSALLLQYGRKMCEEKKSIYWLPPNPIHQVYKIIAKEHTTEETLQRGDQLFTSYYSFPLPLSVSKNLYIPIFTKNEDNFLEVNPIENKLTLYFFDPISNTQQISTTCCPDALCMELFAIPLLSLEAHHFSSGVVILSLEAQKYLYFKTGEGGLLIAEWAWRKMPTLPSEDYSYDTYIFRDEEIFLLLHFEEEEKISFYSSPYNEDAFSFRTSVHSDPLHGESLSIGPYIVFLCSSDTSASLYLFDTRIQTGQFFSLHSKSFEESYYLSFNLSASSTYLVASFIHRLSDGEECHKTFILTLLPTVRLIPLPVGTQYSRGYLYYTQINDGRLRAKVDSFFVLEENLEENKDEKETK